MSPCLQPLSAVNRVSCSRQNSQGLYYEICFKTCSSQQYETTTSGDDTVRVANDNDLRRHRVLDKSAFRTPKPSRKTMRHKLTTEHWKHVISVWQGLRQQQMSPAGWIVLFADEKRLHAIDTINFFIRHKEKVDVSARTNPSAFRQKTTSTYYTLTLFMSAVNDTDLIYCRPQQQNKT